MGWLGDGGHRGQGCQAWTTVGLPTEPPSHILQGPHHLSRTRLWTDTSRTTLTNIEVIYCIGSDSDVGLSRDLPDVDTSSHVSQGPHHHHSQTCLWTDTRRTTLTSRWSTVPVQTPTLVSHMIFQTSTPHLTSQKDHIITSVKHAYELTLVERR